MEKITLITENLNKFGWLSENFTIYSVDLNKTYSTCLNKYNCSKILVDFTSINNPATSKKLVECLSSKKSVAAIINNSVDYKFGKNINIINEQILSKPEIEQKINSFLSFSSLPQNPDNCITFNSYYLLSQLSSEGKILFVNKSFISELGLKNEDLILKNFSTLIPENSLMLYQESLINSRTKNSKQFFTISLFSKGDEKTNFSLCIEYFEVENKFIVLCKKILPQSDIKIPLQKILMSEKNFTSENFEKGVVPAAKTSLKNKAVKYYSEKPADLQKAEKRLKLELEINKAIANISNKITLTQITIEEICSFVLNTLKTLTASNEGFIAVTGSINFENIIYASTKTIVEDFDIYKTESKLSFINHENEKINALNEETNSKSTFFNNNIKEIFRSKDISIKGIRLKNILTTSCIVKEGLIGKIFLGNKKTDYDENDILKVTQIAKIFSLAIQRKQFEDEQKHLQEVLFNMMNEVYIVDINSFKFSYVNNVAVTNLGYTFEEFSQMGIKDIFKYNDDSGGFEYIDSVLTKQAKKVTFEGIHTRKDKSVYPVEVSVKLIKHGETEELLAVVMDITEKKRLEQHRHELEVTIRQQQKLEAIGMLASGVAHEINSPLMGMINYAQLINRRTDNEKLKSFSQGIIDEGDRVAKIVKNLLAFARQEKEAYEYTAIQDIVKSSLVLVGTALRKNNIQIDVNCDNKLFEVSCRSQQIQQVFINLLTNSRDALNIKFGEDSEEKKIIIKCKNILINQINFVQITFEDNGTGIKSEVINKIFDPFFTTKTKEHGTGLGLSISYSIINEHNGRFTCKSELGKFTQFTITLPVTQEFYQTTVAT